MLLYYTPKTCSMSEVVLLEWIGAPYRLCRLEGDTRRGPAYRTINPHGKVPAFETDDGRIITENGAIIQHLVGQHPEAGMAPAPGSPARDTFHQWLSYLASGFHAAFYGLFAPQRYHADEAQHEAVRAATRQQIAQELAYVAGELERSGDFVLPEGKSALDGYLFVLARWAEGMFDYAADYPALAGFMARMRQDEGVQRALAIESGDRTEGGALQGHVALAPRS